MGPFLADAGRKALTALTQSLHAPSALATLRERAIAAWLNAERARLSAGLLQPGLFDRRAERAFAAQQAVLSEALARCQARLDEIDRARRIHVERRCLAFAVLRR
jgi:hypothetical protein